MRCRIDNIMPIIVATAILHNIARRMGEELPPVPEDMDPHMLEYLIDQENIPEMPADNNNPLLINHRQQIIENFFNNLVIP